jgi:hypothetical protein
MRLREVSVYQHRITDYFSDNSKLPTWCTIPLFYIVCLLHSSTWFEHYMLIIRRIDCINTASGVVTLCKWLVSAQVKKGVLS